VNTAPLLGPLADNGGPTWTHALLAGSPAIDAADDAACVAPPINGVDQRGVARPQGVGCDVGAFERVEGAHRRVELRIVVEVGLAPDARGVHQRELTRRRLPLRVNCVHRGAGRGLDDHAVLAEQRVHDRGLAHIGPPHDGDARVLAPALPPFGRELRQHAVVQPRHPRLGEPAIVRVHHGVEAGK